MTISQGGHRCSARCIAATVALAAAWTHVVQGAPVEGPLYTQPPTDLVVLTAANQSTELEFLPLDDRAPRATLPKTGELVGRLDSAPGEEVAIAYSDIDRIELFEERLLGAAKRHAAAGEFTDAFDYFARLDRDYPEYPGVSQAFTSALFNEARARFDAGEHDHALALLGTLHERSAATPGLPRAVEVIGEAILKARWEASDFIGVRRTVDAIESQFAGLRLGLGKRWLGRIEEGAQRERQRAEDLADRGRTREALRVLSGAMALDPDGVASHRLLEKISAAEKTLWVGVWEAAAADAVADLEAPAALRQARLVGGRLATLEAYQPSGGEYAATAGSVENDDSRRRLTIRLSQAARPTGGTGPKGRAAGAHDLARLLLTPPIGAADPLSLLRDRAVEVGVTDGTIDVVLRGPHLQPLALLAEGLPSGLSGYAPGRWRRVTPPSGSEAAARYERLSGSGAFDAVEEFVYRDEDAAIEALNSRQVHVLADAPPWRLTDLGGIPGVKLAAARLPTLHVLLLHTDSPLRSRRETRRALCYALARRETLEELLVGGEPRTGFEPLSAPLPRGKSLSDSQRYAYTDSIEPRPYEPRLAALLLTAARAEDAAADPGELAAPPLPTTLTLAHPPTPLARLACGAIREQLQTVGFGVELLETSEADFASGRAKYDLRYAELTMGEPLADVWRLLGPGGLSGGCSPAVREGLAAVNSAPTGKEAVAALRDLHRIVYADLPLIPLWQTVPHFAWLETLEGPAEDAVDLYQAIDKWRVVARGGKR